MSVSLKEMKAKGYKSITYKAFWDEGKINKNNIEQFKEVLKKYDAIIDEKKKNIWFGGLGERNKDFFNDLDKFVGIK
jgi:DnaJ-class molecular chaperone